MKKSALIFAFSIIGCLSLNAQSAKDLRIARTTALNVYDRYIIVMNSLRNGGEYVYNFKDIFSSTTDSIYNDIIPHSGTPYVGSDDYCKFYTSSVKQANYSYSGFSMEQPRLKGNKWIVVCHFDRSVRYRSKEDFRYPDWQFNYTMRIEMDRNTGGDGLYSNPKVTSLTVSNPLNNFVVIMNPSSYPMQFEGTQLAFNRECKCWVGELGDTKIKDVLGEAPSPFGNASIKKRNPHFYSYQLSKRNIAGFGVYYAPLAIGNKLDKQFTDIKETNNAWRMRGFYGINLVNSANNAAFINIGLEFANRNHKLSGTYETHYDAIDDDADDYTRNIHAQINDERLKVFTLGIPVTFTYLLRIGGTDEKPHFFSMDAGLFASFKAVTRHKLDMHADYTGTYNYFGNIEFDHYYDYGHFDIKETDIQTDINEQMNKIDAGATLGLGLWFSVGKGSFIRTDFSMLKGFLSEMKYNGDFRITETKEDYHTALQSSNNGAFDFYIGLSFIKAL